MSHTTRRNFAAVPRRAMHADLPRNALRVLIYIAGLADQSGMAVVRHERIAADLGIRRDGRNGVTDLIHRLHRENLLRMLDRGRKAGGTYATRAYAVVYEPEQDGAPDPEPCGLQAHEPCGLTANAPCGPRAHEPCGPTAHSEQTVSEQTFKDQTVPDQTDTRQAAARADGGDGEPDLSGGSDQQDAPGRSGLPESVERKFIETCQGELRHADIAIRLLADLVKALGNDTARRKLVGKRGDGGLLHTTPEDLIVKRVREAADWHADDPRLSGRAPHPLPGGSRRYGQISPEEAFARRQPLQPTAQVERDGQLVTVPVDQVGDQEIPF